MAGVLGEVQGDRRDEGAAVKYLSVCSGIEAASVAWLQLGWRCVGVSEIEPFPCSVLQHRFPHVQNLGDMNNFEDWDIEPIDVLVGGTPCQSFSIAGLRGGLTDDRGNLALTYCRILQKFRPRWFVWENVPGVLSSNGGRDFGSILGAMEELGYGIAYRVLDAQYFGVPQRRRRVFVVGCLGDWRRAAEVLFEPGCLRGDSEKGGKKRSAVAALTANGVGTCGADDNQGQEGHLIPVVAETLMSGSSSPKSHGKKNGTDRETLIPVHTTGAGYWQEGFGTLRARLQDSHENLVTSTGNTSHCLNAGGMGRQDYETETMVVNTWGGTKRKDRPDGGFYARVESTTKTLDAAGGLNPACSNGGTMIVNTGVRRLTPVECERLQGFPDNWTLVPHRNKPAADGPRYKAIGNSFAIPCIKWIGERIWLCEN